MRGTGSFKARRTVCVAPRKRRTLYFEDEVLQHVEENPSTSTQNIADVMIVPHTSIWRVLHDQQFHPYHPQEEHALSPAVFAPSVNYYAWFLHQCVDSPEFPLNVFSQMRLTSPGRLF